MAGALVLAIVLAPTLAIVVIVLTREKAVAERSNLAASVVSFLAAVPLPWLTSAAPHVFWASYVIIDALGAWVVLCAAIVYLLASIYAVGYMRLLDEDERLPVFYALFAGFALTTLVGPMMNNAGLYWIAIELTTLVSTFLVAFERAAESIERTALVAGRFRSLRQAMATRRPKGAEILGGTTRTGRSVSNRAVKICCRAGRRSVSVGRRRTMTSERLPRSFRTASTRPSSSHQLTAMTLPPVLDAQRSKSIRRAAVRTCSRALTSAARRSVRTSSLGKMVASGGMRTASTSMVAPPKRSARYSEAASKPGDIPGCSSNVRITPGMATPPSHNVSRA